MRRRKIRLVHMNVSENFYKLLDEKRNKLSFPVFTELIHKDLIFPKSRKLRKL